MPITRRRLLHTACVWPLASHATGAPSSDAAETLPISLCLNAYSFNRLLRNGELSLNSLFRFAKDTGFHGVDLTAYYIPGYPGVPADAVLFRIKKSAFRLGLALTGTGVRNNFTLPAPEDRQREIQLVKNWVVAAAKLGIPHLRIFDGTARPQGFDRREITDWLVKAMRVCAEFGEAHGVVISYQNHNDFTTTAAQAIEIIERVDSDWFGLMLDIGSLGEGDPYREIERLIPYAVSWQVKEQVLNGPQKQKTDFARLMQLVRQSGYRGYFPLETLGAGDPFQKVKALYREVCAFVDTR